MNMFLGTAGAASAAGTAMNIFGYNRDAWMTDVQVNQGRRFQKINLILSQVGMFRDDIRVMIGAAVTRQNNYIVVTTLVLGTVGVYYIEAVLAEGTPEFLTTAFFTCLGCSLFYLSMAVLVLMRACHLAVTCQRDMLTTVVRLPIEELVQDIDRAAPGESVEAFEHQGLHKILRVPGVGRIREKKSPTARRRSSEGSSPDGDKSPDSPEFSGSPGGNDGSPDAEAEEAEKEVMDEMEKLTNDVEDMNRKRKMYLAVFEKKERDWALLGQYALQFGFLGLHHLIQSWAYYSVAKYSGNSADWCGSLVQWMFAVVDCIFSVGYCVYSDGFFCGGTRTLLNVVGVAGSQACLFFINHQKPGVKPYLVPMLFGCHFLVNCMAAWRIHEVRKAWLVEEGGSLGDGYTELTTDSPISLLPEQQDERIYKVYHAAMLTCLPTLAWLLCICWSILYHPRDSLASEATARQLQADPWDLVANGLVAAGSGGGMAALDYDRLSSLIDVEIMGSREWRDRMQEKFAHMNTTLFEMRANRGKLLLKEAMNRVIYRTNGKAGRAAVESNTTAMD